jgi:hypothetical protein
MGDPGEGWRRAARSELLRLRGRATAWGYRRAAAPGVEPTALACLALLASRDAGVPRTHAEESSGGEAAVIAACAGWLATLQRADGSLGLSEARSTPGWTTPLGLLLWQAVGGHEVQRRRGEGWLLGQEGEPMSPSDDPDHIVGHDTMLVGWPWVGGTHSWLEPTAMAVLALRRAGLGEHPRVVEGVHLIHDRAIVTGGWNYGNKSAFGHPLRPQPGPTGLALLALANRDGRTAIVEAAIRYLHETLPGVRASASLGWGLLGLRAWRREPAGAEGWLAEAHRRATGRPDAAPKLALLLLAGGNHALQLFE